MVFSRALRLSAGVVTVLALAGCDMLPLRGRTADQAVADTTPIVEESGSAASAIPPARARRRTTARRPPAPAAADTVAAADSAPPPPPRPTPADRARSAMMADLQRLERAQAEHLANQGRYSGQLSRLGLRYIPHAGVRVQLVEGDAAGWAAVATHADFPQERCALWVGQAPSDIRAIAPAPGHAACVRQ